MRSGTLTAGGTGGELPPGSEGTDLLPPGLPPWRQPGGGEGGAPHHVFLASSVPPNVSGCSENEGGNA